MIKILPKIFSSGDVRSRENRIKVYLFLFITSILLLFSGGRLVSSDEVSMYLTVESLVQNGTFDIPLESAVNATIFNGKAYTWYEAGNILAGIPLYLIGRAAVIILPVSEPLAELLPRTFVSFTGVFIGGFLAVMFYSFCRKFGLSVRFAVLMTFVLIFSTFLLPYFKSYLREPLLSLCLIGGMHYLLPVKYGTQSSRSPLLAGLFTGFGVLTKFVFVLNIIPLLIYLFWPDRQATKRSFKDALGDSILFMIPILSIGFLGTGIYNLLRYGNFLEMGYSGGTAFSTPLSTGLYGLLFSSGKGLFWFAPILILLPAAIKQFWKQYKKESVCIITAFLIALFLYGKYVAWGGDGSWGPRYLAPMIPLLLVMVAIYLNYSGNIIRRTGYILILSGCVIQIGGTAIYPGAYLREIGEFPFKRSFDDPEFLYKAHYIPEYSPIAGHWTMFIRNLNQHLAGNYPILHLDGQQYKSRLPIPEEEQSKLLQTLDFSFTYALYAKIPIKATALTVICLLSMAGTIGFLLLRTVKSSTS